ncbi:hypothetical protein MGG_04363 [Pyricularia oryzae 70-15]|uniref:Sister chromatid separation protein n=3 Tax=Pyricularia oryzae TaxID=318829 RepID=G4MZB2_PYRO7|nr:uncharacterized protein MGG_04363 [Pyricularia oryzae 70-15]EHA53667.1 hypothetical protein MGG_04363 [Pyricularia oryzae 70-15]ELQ33238.1 hypothetical protein OOU_Y34scaffold00979g21 [Pyricularia oryzae Y34]KAI7918763.1 hypothetical protein M0657_007455 [Pyricularia oryzae]
MSDPESDYLQPGFDPRTLTIPRLRSIMVTYNIPFPSNAKKGELIELFNDHVAPQAHKILAKRERAKRSSMGITDAQMMHSASMEDMDDFDEEPRARTTRSRSPRKTSRVKRESEEPERLMQSVERPLSPRKRSVRSVSRQVPSDTETDGDNRLGVRATSRRSVTPAVKLEAPVERRENLFASPRRSDYNMLSEEEEADDGNPFTSDNPFQSGSSPPAVKTPSNRRRTTGGSELSVSKNKSAQRRRTDGPVIQEPMSRKTSRTYEIPVSALRRPRTLEHLTSVEPGEEFTPDEQLELAQEEAEHGVVARREAGPPRSRSWAPFWVVIFMLLGVYGGWYRQEKIKVGYCGLGQQPTAILPPEVQEKLPEWAEILVEPQCEACPAHAYCYEDFSVRCEDDYLMVPHPLSLGGLVPLPPTCEPDGEKVRRVKAVVDKAVEELRERRAQYECGTAAEKEEEKPVTPSIEEEVLKNILSDKRSKKMGKQEFDDLWEAAIGDIKERDEVEEEEDKVLDSSGVSRTRLSSTSLARLPLTCSLRRTFRLGLERYRLYLCAVVVLILSGFWARFKYRRHVATKAQVPRLVDMVLERLAAQKELAYDTGEDDPFLFLPNLRDDVLREKHSLAERERIWQRVRTVVEQNSNVRQGQREGRDGEVGRAWEWIGPTAGGGAIGSASGARRRTLGGRVSFGAGLSDKDEHDSSALVESPADRTATHKKWREGGGRPAF